MINYHKLASALYLINKQAKKDIAKERKEYYYSLKNQVLNKLWKQNSLKYLGYTKIYNSYYGKSYWGCYKLGNLSFHSQIQKPFGKKLKNLKTPISDEISDKINWSKYGTLPTVTQALKKIKTFLKIKN